MLSSFRAEPVSPGRLSRWLRGGESSGSARGTPAGGTPAGVATPSSQGFYGGSSGTGTPLPLGASAGLSGGSSRGSAQDLLALNIQGKDDADYGAVEKGVGSRGKFAIGCAGGLQDWWDHGEVVLFASVLCLANVAEGYDMGVLNGALVRVGKEMHFSTHHASMVTAASPLCILIGFLCGGAMADAWGRKTSLLAGCQLLVVGPIVCALAANIHVLILGRCIVGMASGIGLVIVSAYIAEVAPHAMRGRLLVLEQVFLSVGLLLGYLMNWVLFERGGQHDWRFMFLMGCIPSALLMLMLLFGEIPESPRWLCMRDRPAEAEEVLRHFLFDEEVVEVMETMNLHSSAREGTVDNFASFWSLLTSMVSRGGEDRLVGNALIAGSCVAVAQMACGQLVVLCYSSWMLAMHTTPAIAFRATFFLGVVRVVAVLCSLVFIEQVGRKTLLLTSTCIIALAWVLLTYAALVSWPPAVQVLGFAIFSAGYEFGQGPVMLLYISEIFPTEVRAKGISLCLVLSRIVAVAWTYAFLPMVGTVGEAGTYLVLLLISIFFVFLITIYVVETRDCLLEKVQELFTDDGEKT